MPPVPHELRTIRDIRHAAQVYAAAGWYVLPVRRGRVKHAGSVLGTGWPDKTSRDEHTLDEWFGDDRHGIALHVGRSGAVCLDVDEPQHLPLLVADALATTRPVFQSTRHGDDIHARTRGHYLFTLPDGVMLGNGLGRLRTVPPWGDCRGRNGIIVVSPTYRPEARKRYTWVRTGQPPELPRVIARELLGSHRPPPTERQKAAPVGVRLHGVLRKLTGAVDGERNTLLFWCACRAGEMVNDGLIDQQTAYDVLIDIALALGLPQRESVATVASGLKTGAWAAGA